MANGKKSFVMYCEWQEVFQKLDNEQAGKLIKHIFSYVNDENPEAPDVLTDLVFTPIKLQFKRDLKKYEGVAERNRANGLKGGRPKKENPENPVGYLGLKNNPENPIKDKGKRIKDNEDGNGKEKNIVSTEKKTPTKKSLKSIPIEDLHPIQIWINENCQYLVKIKDQLTFKEAESLIAKFPKPLIKKKILALENKKDCQKNYNSVYLTLNNWCKGEVEKDTPAALKMDKSKLI